MRRLASFGLVHGSAFWSLTWKGEIYAKLLSLLPNNPKDYTRGLKNEIIEFEYCPHS